MSRMISVTPSATCSPPRTVESVIVVLECGSIEGPSRLGALRERRGEPSDLTLELLHPRAKLGKRNLGDLDAQEVAVRDGRAAGHLGAFGDVVGNPRLGTDPRAVADLDVPDHADLTA